VPPDRSPARVLAYAAAVCVVAAVAVSGTAVGLRDRQIANAEIERQRNVLQAAGAAGPGERLAPDEVGRRFAAFEAVAVDLYTGREAPGFDLEGYDPRQAAADPDTSLAVPDNPARVARVPRYAIVYRQRDEDGRLALLVLPVEGQGLWSTLYGYLALEPDLVTIRGLAFYEHGETPGLGGEITSPRWTVLWPGRRTTDQNGVIAIEVARGPAGPPSEDPYRVDGISGATLTGRGVTALVRFWIGPNGFGPYLDSLRQEAR